MIAYIVEPSSLVCAPQARRLCSGRAPPNRRRSVQDDGHTRVSCRGYPTEVLSASPTGIPIVSPYAQLRAVSMNTQPCQDADTERRASVDRVARARENLTTHRRARGAREAAPAVVGLAKATIAPLAARRHAVAGREVTRMHGCDQGYSATRHAQDSSSRIRSGRRSRVRSRDCCFRHFSMCA